MIRLRTSIPLPAAIVLLISLAVAATSLGAPAAQDLPFAIGERLEYQARFGPIRGKGVMEVVGEDTVRGRSVLHLRFAIEGGIPMLRIDDQLDSWLEPERFISLRHHQKIREARYKRDRTFEIFPEEGFVIAQGRDTLESVAEPLDDGSFLYFVRTIPLVVGETYVFDRYFRADRNPVTIKVLRKERIRVKTGEYDAIVIQPIIKASGMFAEGGEAQLWLSDDERRIMLQMKTKFSVGTITLELTRDRPGPP
jgi:hypothetical protein